METINKKINTVYLTNQFNKFKYLDGNRSVTDGRVAKIKQSIQNIGYIPIPCVVNEKMEIIDGQGRIAACQELGIPVAYIVLSGLSLKHCISLNINQKNWNMPDYINSYASTGDSSYQFLQALMREYLQKPFQIGTIIYSVHLQIETQGNGSVKNGSFHCTESEYNNAREKLNIAKGCREKLTEILGSSRAGSYPMQALLFYLNSSSADISRLQAVLSNNKNYSSLMNFVSAPGMTKALECLDAIYNANLPHNKRISVKQEYEDFQWQKKHSTNH